MQQFPTAAHLASWAAICPGNNKSAGKRKSGKTRKGNPWLRQAAHSASHQKQSMVAYVKMISIQESISGRERKFSTIWEVKNEAQTYFGQHKQMQN
jgi:transposase